MSKQTLLSATKRDLLGRKVKTLRAQGLVPANIYGKKIPSLAISIVLNEFKQVFKAAGETTVIQLSVEGEKTPRPVLVSHLQAHPVSRHLLHIDLHQIDLTEKIKATVPLKFEGKSKAESLGAMIVHVQDAVDVEALPSDLPHEIIVDISSLSEVGQSILVKDLPIDRKKVTILLPEDEPVVKVDQPRDEKEEEVEQPVVAEAQEGAKPDAGAKDEKDSGDKAGDKKESGAKKE